jgi:4-aminobutyrate aminotransferase-like enzyme
MLQDNVQDSARFFVAPPVPRAHFTLVPKIYTGPRAEDVLQQRKQHLSAGQYHFYRQPLMLVEASMQYCFDDKGKVYVDAYSNVCHVGHCHPHFVASCQSAMSNIISNTRYLHPTIGRYAEKLKSKLPSSLSVCYFVNSGSEANDLAMRLARVHTGKKGVICLEHAYHGTTSACTGVSTSLSTGTTKGTVDYEYCARDVHVVPVPDPYRGKYRGEDPEAGRKYADEVRRVCEKTEIAAFIHESVQGVGGQIVYPKDFLRRAYTHVRATGGVTIADEVQTGFGRTGTHFWAFEAQEVVPDIVVMGKPIGNGFPLGAVVCTREIARSFDGVQYFNTNGGNPVACAAGLAVLEIIERDNLQKNALDVSAYFMKELLQLKKKHPMIGDVRGVGLFVGIELIRDPHSMEPATTETAEVMERCRDFGLLVGKGGYLNNVIRIKPPLCFTAEDASFAVRTLDAVLSEIEHHPRPASSPTRKAEHPDTYINCASPHRDFDLPNKRTQELRNSAQRLSGGDRRRESFDHSANGFLGSEASLPHSLEENLRRSNQRRSGLVEGRKRYRSPSSSSDEDDEADFRPKRGPTSAGRGSYTLPSA